jgi:hypothetical protein
MVSVKSYDRAEAEKSDHVEVCFHEQPEEPGVTRVTIRPSSRPGSRKSSWDSFIRAVPLDEETALRLAKAFAERVGIGTVYVRREPA